MHRIAQELGVSKQPVLTAMRQIEAIGLVEIVPQSGCRVAQFSEREVRHFFEAFAASEAELAGLAAEHRTPAQLDVLRMTWSEIEGLGTNTPDALSVYLNLNRAFHRCVHEMAASRPAALASAGMWDLCDFLVGTLGGSRAAGMAAERNAEHLLILEAIEAGALQLARDRMRDHICTNVAITGV